jgi:hypothetical protein
VKPATAATREKQRAYSPQPHGAVADLLVCGLCTAQLAIGDQIATDGILARPLSTAAGLAMAFKLIEAGQARWRAPSTPTSSPSSAPAPAE